MTFCLFDLTYDVCYELVVIMEFGSISETGWGDVLTQSLGEFFRKKLSARTVSNSQMRHKRFKKRVHKGGAPETPSF